MSRWQDRLTLPDNHPLSVGASRSLRLQQADIVFLMGARFNWIMHFGQPSRYSKDVGVIQLDVVPEEIGHNKATEVARVGDGKAIVGQLNKALGNSQWFYPKDTPWRSAIAQKSAENAAMIRPQIQDETAPANYYRALRDVAAWAPEDAIICSEGASTMDIGRTPIANFRSRHRLDAGTYGTMGYTCGGTHDREKGIRNPQKLSPFGRLSENPSNSSGELFRIKLTVWGRADPERASRGSAITCR
jgi:2-hydroxyacyl-CoA lyase 1